MTAPGGALLFRTSPASPLARVVAAYAAAPLGRHRLLLLPRPPPGRGAAACGGRWGALSRHVPGPGGGEARVWGEPVLRARPRARPLDFRVHLTSPVPGVLVARSNFWRDEPLAFPAAPRQPQLPWVGLWAPPRKKSPCPPPGEARLLAWELDGVDLLAAACKMVG